MSNFIENLLNQDTLRIRLIGLRYFNDSIENLNLKNFLLHKNPLVILGANSFNLRFRTLQIT